MKLVFATNNAHKLDEIRHILGASAEVLSLNDIGCHVDIPETGTTLEENALQKAQYVYDNYHLDVFADDTGLEVEALGGAPGVYSARYAGGEGHDSEANMQKLLRELEGVENRNARFRTVIALIQTEEGKPVVHEFEGIVEGTIIREKRGGEGFGYDPVFEPAGYDKTFAELGAEIKNHISHRARATKRLTEYLLRMLIVCFTLCSAPAFAQIGTWKNYLAYSDVQQICAADDKQLFVRASNALYQYNQNDQSITTFDKTNGLSDVYITHIAWCPQAHRLIAVYQNANIDLLDIKGNITNISSLYAKAMTGDKTVSKITIDGKFAYLHCGFGIVKVNVSDAEIADTYTPNHPEYPTSLPDYDENQDYAKYIDVVSTLLPGGPKTNYFGFMKYENNCLYTCGGSDNPASIQLLKEGEWTSFALEGISEKTGQQVGNIYCLDYDPTDDSRVVAGALNGLYEFRNAQFLNYFNRENSPIESFNGSSKHYQLVTGTKFDTAGNLFFMNSQAPTQSLIEYTKEGKFVSISIPELMKLDDAGYKGKSLANLSKLMFDSNGFLWFVNNNHILTSFYRYDLENNKLNAYTKFVNQDGTAYATIYYVTCIKEDKSGNIWIGTNIGPFMLEKSQIEQEDYILTQVKIPRNDGTDYADYLLSGVYITDIAIDEAGRKWIGTNGSGAYLISADNLTQLQNFTTENSSLLSNDISSIAINNTNGEVFFGTNRGLCSYISDATTINEEMTKDNVWAYPNPVTPAYTGLITIVGLSYNADVKILSSNGHVVAEGRSNGGSFTWNGCDKEGNRVASGVYMVATATSDGQKGTVCKIAIVR